MIRRFSLVPALVLLLLAVMPLSACGEGASLDLGTPTDLCTHENTETVYYFDSPVYRALDAWTHQVSGRATVVTVCADCGAALAAVVEENAQQVKNHAFARGRCALCGMEAPAPREKEISLASIVDGESSAERFGAAFTLQQLSEGDELWVLRAGDYIPALVLQPRRLAAGLAPEQVLQAEMRFPDERTVEIILTVLGTDGVEIPADPDLAALRFYRKKEGASVPVLFIGEETEVQEAAAVWVNASGGGYYQLAPLPGNGVYEF